MRNFTATETFAWGRDNRAPEATDAYETLIVDGEQSWRRPGSRKFYGHVPFPPSLSMSVVPGSDWSYLPQMVGTDLNLKIHHAPDAVVGGRTVHVFQYAATEEDEVCGFRHVMLLGLFEWGKQKWYDCHGEVWTDESGTILRISVAYDPGPWYRGVMSYGWLEKDGRQYSVPVTLTTEVGSGSTHWCRGLFMDYEMFSAKSHLVVPTELAQKSGIDTQ